MPLLKTLLEDRLDGCYRITLFDEVDSTNRMARDAALKGADEYVTMIANSQTDGRGRKGRSFFSPEDTGLYISVVLRPTADRSPLQITTAAAVAVAESIEEIANTVAEIKWVNDVYCRGKKVCGILTEGSFEGDKLQYAVLGIGVNVILPNDGFPKDIASRAGAVFDEKTLPTDDVKERLAAAILNRFKRYYEGSANDYLSSYRQRNMLRNKQVDLIGVDDRVLETVTVLDVTDTFELLVQDSSGKARSLSSGEVSLQLC